MPLPQKKRALVSILMLGGVLFLFSILTPSTFAGHENLASSKKFRSPYFCAKFFGNKNTGAKCNGGDGFWTGIAADTCTDPSQDEAAQVAAGKIFDCHTAVWVDSSAPPPACSFNTTDGGAYDLTKPESGSACSYGSDGATGSITYTYKTLKGEKVGTCTKLSPDPTKTDNCCHGTPYSCTFDRCPASKPSTAQKATCTQSNSYLGGASCPGTSDKYVGGVKVTTFPPERACNDCSNGQYSSCLQTSCSGGKKVNTCSTRPADCSGPESKDITTSDNCDTCADSDYTNCTADLCSGSSKVKRCTSWPSTCTGSLDSGQTYHTVSLGTCYTYYSACSWNTSKCSLNSGTGAGQKTRSCTEEKKPTLTADTFQDASYITSPQSCADCSIDTDYTCTFTNCPSTAPEQTNRSSITSAMESATCTINSAVSCKPLSNPSKTRTCTTCTQDIWTSGAPSTCDDSTSKQTLDQTETFNCEADSNDVSGTTYTIGGVTYTLKTGSKVEVGSNTPKLYKRTLEVDCTPAPGGNLPTGDVKGQTLRYNGSKWEKSIALFNYDGPKIGIGTGYSITATPSEVLQVSANADTSLTSRLLVTDTDTGNNPEIQLGYGSNTNEHWSLFIDKAPIGGTGSDKDNPRNSFNIWGAGASGNNRLTILPNGNVGIGATAPELPLQIDHTTAPFLGFRTTGDTANSVRFSVGARDGGTNASRRAEIEVQSKHDLAFFTSSTLRAMISSDGSFIIGTSTQFADFTRLLVHKEAIPGTGVITGEGTASSASMGANPQPTDRSGIYTPPGAPGAVPIGSPTGIIPVPAAPTPPPSYTPPSVAPIEAPIPVAPTPPQPTAPAAPASVQAPVQSPTPSGAGGTPVNTPVQPTPAPVPTHTQQPTPNMNRPAAGGTHALAPSRTLLSSLTGFFSNLWNTITGSPIQSSYAVNLPFTPPTGNGTGGGSGTPDIAPRPFGASTQTPAGENDSNLPRKVLTGSGTKFSTELDLGDYLYIPEKSALFVLIAKETADADKDTKATFIQIAGRFPAAIFEGTAFAPLGTGSYAYTILKKGSVFKTERDVKDKDGKPAIVSDLIVDNRGIVNVNGIAPWGLSDLALYVSGKALASEFCLNNALDYSGSSVNPGGCIANWNFLKQWDQSSDGTALYPKLISAKVGIGTTEPKTLFHIASDRTGEWVADDNVGQFIISGAGANGNKRLGFMIDTTNDVGKIQAQQKGIGAFNLALQPKGGRVGIGTDGPQESLQIGDSFAFHTGGHKVLAFGYSPAANKALAAGYPAEMRWLPSDGKLMFGIDTTLRASGDTPIDLYEKKILTLTQYRGADTDSPNTKGARMRGRVGINTDDPQYPLDIRIDGKSDYGTALNLQQGQIGNYDGPKIRFSKLSYQENGSDYYYHWVIGMKNGERDGSFVISNTTNGGFGDPKLTITPSGSIKTGGDLYVNGELRDIGTLNTYFPAGTAWDLSNRNNHRMMVLHSPDPDYSLNMTSYVVKSGVVGFEFEPMRPGGYWGGNLTLTTEGRVGIQSPYPEATLDVHGDTKIAGNMNVNGRANFSSSDWSQCCASSNEYTLSLSENTRTEGQTFVDETIRPRATIQFHNAWEAEGFIKLAAGDHSRPAFWQGSEFPWVPGTRGLTERRFIFGSYQEKMSGEFTGNVYANGKVDVAFDHDTLAKAKSEKNLALSDDRIGVDVAELFPADEEVEAGDVLIASVQGVKGGSVKKSTQPYEEAIVGVVSTAPAALFEGTQMKLNPEPGLYSKGKKPAVALAGRVPVKVSLENGPIKPGDPLTSSSKPGVAMKSTKPGATIGIALEAHTLGESKIMVFLARGIGSAADAVKNLQQRVEALEKKVK